MTAIRLARGFTGRDLLVKFAGHYHGHSDGLLAEAGSGVATLALPGSAGVPAAIAAQTLVLPYNDLDAVRAVFAEHGDRIAAVIVEAAAANMGVVAAGCPASTPRSPSSRTRTARCSSSTRCSPASASQPAGCWGLEAAQRRALHARPLHLRQGHRRRHAARRARRPRRRHGLLAPLGPVYQAGTLSGNPVAVAAGLATLRLADAAVYARLDAAADADRDGRVRRARGRGRRARRAARGQPVQLRVRRGRGAARLRRGAARRRRAGTRRSSTRCSTRASRCRRRVFEAWFVTAAHDDEALGRIVDALPGRGARRGIRSPGLTPAAGPAGTRA